MNRTHERPNQRFAMSWTLAEDQPAAPPMIIDLTQARLAFHRNAHCPACQGRHIQMAVTPCGRSVRAVRGLPAAVGGP